MSASTTSRPFLWAGLSVGLAALLTALWGGVHLYRSYGSAKAQFVRQAVLSAQVFAESAKAALELGGSEEAVEARLQRIAQLFVRGDVLYAQIVHRGRVKAEDRVEAALPLKLDVGPLQGGRVRVQEGRLPDGTPYLDVWRALPGPSQPQKAEDVETEAEKGRASYVRVGISLREVGYRLRGEALMTIGLGTAIVAAVGLVAVGLAALNARSRRGAAYDYACAPGKPALAANGGLSSSPKLQVGPLTIDVAAKEVRLNGHLVQLSPKEFELLKLLASRPGHVFSSREILQRLWPEGSFATAKDVKQYVYLLRRKLERDPKHPELIVTVKGFGYKLAPPAQPSDPHPPLQGTPSKAKGEEPS